MQICISNNRPDIITYTTSIPTGTDAGTYSVWYKVVGDANHTDTSGRVPVTVSKREVTVTVTGNSAVSAYDRKAHSVSGYTVRNC